MAEDLWPPLGEGDAPTIAALHLFSQIVGKVATAVAPWRNHGWHLTLHLTPRGWRTEPLHLAGETIELELVCPPNALCTAPPHLWGRATAEELELRAAVDPRPLLRYRRFRQ